MPKIASAALALSLLAAPAFAQPSCTRPSPRTFKEGETIVISETKSFPCRIQFSATNIALRADSATVKDFKSAVRLPDGRFYTYASGTAELSIWAPDGRFIKNVGRMGQGPGDLARGSRTLIVDRAGRLLIADANRRWSIFSPTLDFIASTGATLTGIGTSNSGLLLDDGTYVSSRIGGDFFALYDFNALAAATIPAAPPLLRTFGPSALRLPPTPISARRVASAGGSTFWAAPPDGGGWGYEIELWRTDGVRLRTIRRDVPWYPSGPSSLRGADVPPPEMEILHDDGTGLLFVAIVVANDKFAALGRIADNDQRTAAQDSAVDIYMEVIDANAGIVLASEVIRPSRAMKELPLGFFGKGRQGYRREETPNGLPVLRIIEFKLFTR